MKMTIGNLRMRMKKSWQMKMKTNIKKGTKLMTNSMNRNKWKNSAIQYTQSTQVAIWFLLHQSTAINTIIHG